VIAVEEHLVEGNGAVSGFPEDDKGERIGEGEGYMFGKFEFAGVFSKILSFHSAKIKQEGFAGSESFVRTVPLLVLDEGILAAKLVFISVLGVRPD
jgi:hypothetical protein